MKKALRTDLRREMRKSFNRYISILLIMALGVAFYAGVRSAEPDMQLSAKAYFDITRYMDIRVLGTLGMTEEDVVAIEAIEGIEAAEGGYQTELFLEAGQRDYQMSVYSLGESINQVYVTEGRIPQKQNECFMDKDFMSDYGYKIGDVITVKTGEDANMTDILTEDTFTIVGSGIFPNYLSWQRGAVSIGTGVEDGFLFLPKEAFAMEVFTVVYATVEGATELNPYSERYEDCVDEMIERIEVIADARCEIRYAEVTEPYWEEVREAEAEIAEGEKELADGEKELADAETELLNGEQKLLEAEQDIANGEAELAEAEEQIENGEQELAEAEEKLLVAEEELEAAEEELAVREQELAEGERSLILAKEQLVAGRTELETGKLMLDQKEAEFNSAREMLEASGMPLTPELLATKEELAATKALLKEKEAELLAGEAQIAASEAGINAGKEQLILAKEQLADIRDELEAGWEEVNSGKDELEDAKRKAEDGKKELSESREEMEEGRKELDDGRAEIEEAKAELEQAKLELEEGKQELADAKEELDNVKVPEWYVLDRGTVQQLVEYGSNTERVGNLGDVFPAVFYLVAALVSLTTMTRMIEEERTQIGTMKALGYGKGAIVSKYLWYSLSATLLGGVLGVAIGSYVFPWVIMKAYGILYSNIPYIITPVQWDLSLISVLIAVACTVVATMSSCYKEMMAAPASLMRPVAPPAGKRVFLEYIKPLWNVLSFSWKATCRNLFRYKKRFFMTMFGIGGCMALLLVGFGLRDSIMDIVSKQYKEIWTYDAYLSINDEKISLADKTHKNEIKNQMFIQTKTMDIESEEARVSATLFVPERLADLEDFVKLKDRVTEQTYTLTDDTIIITEKLAKLLKISEGDSIELYLDDVTKYQVTVHAIAENYMFHYVYMSEQYYRNLYGEEPEYNQLYLKTTELSEDKKDAFSKEMLADDAVDSVTYVEELQDSVSVMMKSMELVIVVLIVSAGMLAFIVLYNLNNINIIERRRELATLKVLGFYDMEVGNYVYRENVLLTVFGTLAGVIMGLFLHRFVIMTVEIDIMMFGRDIEWPSYIYSILLTFIFAILINAGMLNKLRKIDMVESLKSAE
ncbi:MAG: FtsX-like permease family protein [Lachnospiraceae bacterium]|nr:FtsX-like permease family protein [Lachnospiraceae bacterium]